MSFAQKPLLTEVPVTRYLLPGGIVIIKFCAPGTSLDLPKSLVSDLYSMAYQESPSARPGK